MTTTSPRAIVERAGVPPDTVRDVRRLALIGLACAWGLAGCVTVTEFRQTRPVRVATVGGSYLPMSRCVMEALEKIQGDEGVWYRFSSSPPTGSASILGVVRVPAGLFYTVPDPVLELTFKGGEAGTVTIEARRRLPGSSLEPRMWTLIERCAGIRITPTPPLARAHAALRRPAVAGRTLTGKAPANNVARARGTGAAAQAGLGEH